jgi:malonate-semialdehyde dehydrogenase (acetylating)/methylmalonate-semialdehyde dehydrogenase
VNTIPHYIDGATRPAGDGTHADVFDPGRGEVVARVPLAGPGEVDAAVAAAVAAFDGWSRLAVPRRQRVLFAFRTLLERSQRDVARLISTEHGKTLDDALGEVARGLEVVEYACGVPELLKGEYSREVSRGVDVFSSRQPLGVCVGITPFNFPAMVPLWMFPMAIAAGNTFVLKPSERDPSASVLLAELFTEAGLPPGVLNVLHGDRTAVEALLAHPDVAAVSFVGSTPVARSIYAGAAANGKRVQALGGAKNHLVVAPDADLEVTADAVVSAAFGSAGERCMAVSVVVAVGDVADRLAPLLKERVGNLQIGPGDDPSTDMGPLITEAHRDRVAGYVDGGVGAGASLVVDGRGEMERAGFFLGPSILDHVTTDMDVYRDEVFGPVLAVVRVPDLPSAVALLNDNPYGNGAAVFTESGRTAHWFQQNVHAGMVGINVPIPVPVAFHSFGGWKSSLFGDTHVYGPEGIRFYTRNQVVTTRWPDPRVDTPGVDLNFPMVSGGAATPTPEVPEDPKAP